MMTDCITSSLDLTYKVTKSNATNNTTTTTENDKDESNTDDKNYANNFERIYHLLSFLYIYLFLLDDYSKSNRRVMFLACFSRLLFKVKLSSKHTRTWFNLETFLKLSFCVVGVLMGFRI